MSNSKDNELGSVLVSRAANNHPQIVANLGVQDVYPPNALPQQGYLLSYPTQPGFQVPGTYPNNPQVGYPTVGSNGAYPQGLDLQVVNPQGGYPKGDHPPGGYPQGGFPQGGYPKGDYPQGGPSQDITVPNPTGSKAPELDDSNIYSPADLSDGEAGLFKTLDFTEKTIRRAFIRKVYGILTCQLLITIGFISLFLFSEPIKDWASDNPYMLGIAFVMYFAMAFSMICCSDLRRKAPMNFIFLGLFTVATSYLLGAVTSTFDVDTVMMAVCLTAAVVLSLTLFALQTKYDFTGMGSFLLCALVILLLMGIMWPIMPNRITDLLYAAAGAMIFSLYLVYDTQLMLGGKHKYSISPEEYIFAALNLYLDVINLFIRILYLVARR